MHKDNIFAGIGSSKSQGSVLTNRQSPLSTHVRRHDRPSIGSYRLTETEERSNGPSRAMMDAVQQWKDIPPMSSCAHLSMLHLTPLEHRIEDY